MSLCRLFLNFFLIRFPDQNTGSIFKLRLKVIVLVPTQDQGTDFSFDISFCFSAQLLVE